jgi:hypothetical protein
MRRTIGISKWNEYRMFVVHSRRYQVVRNSAQLVSITILITCHVLCSECENTEASVLRAFTLCNRLAVIDKVRVKYWMERTMTFEAMTSDVVLAEGTTRE